MEKKCPRRLKMKHIGRPCLSQKEFRQIVLYKKFKVIGETPYYRQIDFKIENGWIIQIKLLF